MEGRWRQLAGVTPGEQIAHALTSRAWRSRVRRALPRPGPDGGEVAVAMAIRASGTHWSVTFAPEENDALRRAGRSGTLRCHLRDGVTRSFLSAGDRLCGEPGRPARGA